ncbi:MAG: MutS-related protein, partial [Gemmatimonadales bacterium]
MSGAGNEPFQIYQAQLAQVRARFADESARFSRVGLVRLGVFVAGVLASVATVLARGGVATWFVAGLAVLFIGLVVWHERIARRRELLARSVAYYERGVARLEHRWRDSGDDGARFRSESHLYADDLELFGPGSLFQYLSTAGTEGGASTLAAWLQTPAPQAVIRERQEAVGELVGKLPLRHDLAVGAPEVRDVLDASVLRPWLAAPAVPFPGWIGPAALVVAVANVVTTGLALAGVVPGLVAAISYAVGIALAVSVRDRVRGVLQSVDRPVRELRVLATLVDRARAER